MFFNSSICLNLEDCSERHATFTRVGRASLVDFHHLGLHAFEWGMSACSDIPRDDRFPNYVDRWYLFDRIYEEIGHIK